MTACEMVYVDLARGRARYTRRSRPSRSFFRGELHLDRRACGESFRSEREGGGALAIIILIFQPLCVETFCLTLKLIRSTRSAGTSRLSGMTSSPVASTERTLI